MRGFPGGLTLLGDVKEAGGLGEGALGNGDFLLAPGDAVIKTHDGADETSTGDLKLGLGAGRVRGCNAKLADLR